jgi:hypothetical protein
MTPAVDNDSSPTINYRLGHSLNLGDDYDLAITAIRQRSPSTGNLPPVLLPMSSPHDCATVPARHSDRQGRIRPRVHRR